MAHKYAEEIEASKAARLKKHGGGVDGERAKGGRLDRKHRAMGGNVTADQEDKRAKAMKVEEPSHLKRGGKASTTHKPSVNITIAMPHSAGKSKAGMSGGMPAMPPDAGAAPDPSAMASGLGSPPPLDPSAMPPAGPPPGAKRGGVIHMHAGMGSGAGRLEMAKGMEKRGRE